MHESKHIFRWVLTHIFVYDNMYIKLGERDKLVLSLSKE